MVNEFSDLFTFGIVWAFGVFCSEILTGKEPYGGFFLF
jgi:hypothetical protein